MLSFRPSGVSLSKGRKLSAPWTYTESNADTCTVQNLEIKTWNAATFHLKRKSLPEGYDKIARIQNQLFQIFNRKNICSMHESQEQEAGRLCYCHTIGCLTLWPETRYRTMPEDEAAPLLRYQGKGFRSSWLCFFLFFFLQMESWGFKKEERVILQ